MAFGGLGRSSVLPCRSRSGRPRPISFLGLFAFLGCWGCLRPFFSQPSDSEGGAGGGRGGGSAGSDGGEDAEAQSVPTKAANNLVGAKQIHSNDNKNDGIQQIKLDTANRMKGLLGSMHSIADKLPMFCGAVFIWLLSNSSATNSPTPNSSAPNSPTPNSPASMAGQNFDDPWMQVIIIGSLILCFISFILLPFASKFKERESIDGVLFEYSIWLLLPVYLVLWPGLCMILHFFAHTPAFVLWPLGILFFILSVLFWYLGFYKERKQILEELKKNRVLENGMLPENLEADAALAPGLERDNSYTVQISGPSIIPAYALSK